MEPLPLGATAEPTTRLALCRDPATMRMILVRDYFDEPVCRFSRGVLRTLADDWASSPADVFLVTADIGGQYAGFAFGHTRSRSIWRRFYREYWSRHLAAFAWIWFRTRAIAAVRRRVARRGARREYPADLAASLRQWGVMRTDKPFAWSATPGAGRVDLLFVGESFRGRGLAPLLVKAVTDEMIARGCGLVEAHADAANLASVRAFLKAGWQAVQTASDDFHLQFRPGGGIAQTR